MENNNQLFRICLEVYVSVTLTVAVGFIGSMRSDIQDLNIKMATIMEKVSDYDSRIKLQAELSDSIDRRLRAVEIREGGPPRRR